MAEEWIYGIHAVEAAISAGEVERLWLAPERADDDRMASIRRLAEASGLPVVLEPMSALQRRCHSDQHQGVLARALPLPARDWKNFVQQLPEDALLLMLDGVTDPHNLGACLRSAEAAGVTAVLLPKDHACGITGTVRKAAAGAASRVPVFFLTNLSRTLEDLQQRNFWVAGLAGEAEQSIYDADLCGALVVVMGSEEKGVRRLVREHCDYLLRIPMAGQIESLNVSVATAVVLFEARRQRSGEAVRAHSR
ncbi:23S rRNA (guanosine(2251)-2'-O)-methyltransferase RlmB [Acidithiobacillus sp. AMEEHan]|uniref:23S rRNA (guanosine(2251)-2'-O)-methyltransferase RlmB n=1 Tax=Acidithiobacillus sp. AMEEHan TaxID=2994951 RepID=UPI0027E565D6|nr:23S rRNA (guanosine(2251)-2'-O)-methyltransferase RlmB [Acidithiobacillus sp. AMEEHan]